MANVPGSGAGTARPPNIEEVASPFVSLKKIPPFTQKLVALVSTTNR